MDDEAEHVQADTQVLDTAIAEAKDAVDSQEANVQIDNQENEYQDKQVPLSALQKMRKRAQEAEQKAQWLEEQQKKAAQPEPEPEDAYESATKKDLRETKNVTKQEILREVHESTWIKNNPDKFEKLNEKLPELLKQKPNLAYAIANSLNRYEEAWELMSAFTEKPTKTVPQQAPRRDAPNSPGSVPKAANLNQAVDLMQMSDDEFNKWRSAKRRSR